MQQKVRDSKWYDDFANELVNSKVLNAEKVGVYANSILQDKSLKLKSEQKIRMVRSFVQVYDKLGAYDKSISVINTYLSELGKAGYSDQFAHIWFDLIYDYNSLSKIDSVKYVVETTKQFIKDKSPNYYYWLLANSIFFSNEEKYSEAIKVTFEALKYFEKTNNLDRVAACYNALGKDYGSMNNYKDAITYYLQAIEINKKLGNKEAIARNYNNIGAMYSGLKELDKASKAYEKAYEIISEIGDIQLLAQNLTNRGNIYEKKGDYVNSKKMFQECLELCEKHNIQFGILLSNINLGNTYFLMRDYAPAEHYFNKGLELAIAIKSQNIEALAYEKLAKLHVAKNNFEKAFFLIEKFHKIDDILRSDKLAKETLELKEKYESEKKSNTITVLKGQKLAQQLIIALLIGGILLLILVIQWYRNKQKQSKLETALVLNEKNTLKRVVEAKEKELTVQITQLMKFEDEVRAIHDKVITLIDNNIDTPDAINKKILTILANKSFEDVNEVFNQRIAEVNEDLFKQLLGEYPDLSTTELKLCAYLRLGLSTKEIAQLLNKSVRTIESTRTDIRKKMKLLPQVNLVNHLITLG